jgi:hypothetical protein
MAMLGSEPTLSQMPRLDAFDEEFGREPVAIARGQRRRKLPVSTILGAALGAAVITALAWPWVSADGGLRSEVQALLPISRSPAREGSAEQIDRLLGEVESLKKEIVDLTEARQQDAERIASLEAAEQEPRDRSALVYWYSNLAALNYEPLMPRRASAAPPLRRSATVRTETRTEGRDSRRREGTTPLPLESPQ